MDFERLRKRYYPATIKFLLVGESPPAGGTFFYAANSRLFAHTKTAFQQALGCHWNNDLEFLSYFSQLGCFLDDLCLQPVNHFTSPERRTAQRQGIDPLANKIIRYNPQVIVSTPLSIKKHVQKSLDISESSAAFSALPFPVMQHVPNYISGLVAILKHWQGK